MLEVLTLSGSDAAPYVEELARLRIEVFREYPYLYDGDMAYETEYVDTFLKAQNNFMAVVKDGNRVVGASTGLPLVEETDNIKQPFIDAGYSLRPIFYFGESVLLPPYRGKGFGKQFFELREDFARSLGGFNLLAFCAVARPDNHPQRPNGYQPLDGFWKRQGFSPTDLYCYINWQEIGQGEESPKALRFWTKPLNG